MPVARPKLPAPATPPAEPSQAQGKRGPKTSVSDVTLLDAIRAVLAACPFYGEGYRKVRARAAWDFALAGAAIAVRRGGTSTGQIVWQRVRGPGLVAAAGVIVWALAIWRA